MTPKIHVTEKGKRYFIVNGKRVYVNSKLTRKELSSLYKLLKKKIISSKNKTIRNTAQAIVNINQEPKQRRQYRRTTTTPTKPYPSPPVIIQSQPHSKS